MLFTVQTVGCTVYALLDEAFCYCYSVFAKLLTVCVSETN